MDPSLELKFREASTKAALRDLYKRGDYVGLLDYALLLNATSIMDQQRIKFLHSAAASAQAKDSKASTDSFMAMARELIPSNPEE